MLAMSFTTAPAGGGARLSRCRSRPLQTRNNSTTCVVTRLRFRVNPSAWHDVAHMPALPWGAVARIVRGCLL